MLNLSWQLTNPTNLQFGNKHTMILNLIIVLLLGTIVALLHITGLVLLVKVNDITISGNQKYLIIALSLTELALVGSSFIRETIFYTTGSETNIVGLCVSLYTNAVIGFMYYFIMFAITLDRLLQLRFNIKYHLYWNKNRTKNTLILVSCIVNASWVVLSCTILFYQDSKLMLSIHDGIRQIYFRYYAPVSDTIFIIFAIIVYFYIFLKLYKNRKKEEKVRKQIRCNETADVVVKVNRYRIPFWIILTFMLFWIVPNTLLRIYHSYPVSHEYFYSVSYVLFRIGCIADAIIYIFHLNNVKIKLSHFKINILNKIIR